MLTFIFCPQCPTCHKAQALLDSHDVPYDTRDIKTKNPTYDELKEWLVLSELPVKNFFNISGSSYDSMGLKDKLPTMNEDECLRLLATNGMLLKCPLLVDYDGVLVGFNHAEWDTVLTEMDSVPNEMTIEMTDSNNIYIPFEWSMRLDFGNRYVQITLVDDRIAIHKPTDADAVYTKPCKAGDNSYIRTLGLFDVRVPKRFFEILGIKIGDRIDLSLEENCVSIRKNTDVIPEVLVPKPPEPIMAFCCICGHLLYTDNALIKVLSKYICHDCIEVVKTLENS